MRRTTGREPAGDADRSLLLDRHLPEYDVTVARHAIVDADPRTTYEAALAADLTDTGPAVRALARLRDAPAVVSRWLRGAPRERPPDRLRFVDVPASDEWTLLDESPGEEFVVGAVGTFWKPTIEWRRIDPGAFAAFDDPGYAKLAIGLSVRPYGEGRTLLSYEARTATTDERARRKFARYWRVVGPFAGYLMGRALDRIGADAEVRERRGRTTGARGRTTGASAGDGEAGDDGVEKRDDPDAGPTGGSDDGPRGGDDGPGGGPTRRRRRVVVAALLALAAAYHLVLRPWHRRWGATDAEARGPLPGDDLLPGATRQVTHAITIDAPAERVWPWLVQMGQGRGGFYSYDWLESAVGAGIHNADRILPEHQDLAEGDVVRLAPEDYPFSSPESAPEVARLDPERALVLRPPGESPAWTWAFVLDPVGGGRTRLLARTRSDPRRTSIGPLAGRPRLLEAVDYVFWEPVHFVMERGMLRGIRRRAEGDGGPAAGGESGGSE